MAHSHSCSVLLPAMARPIVMSASGKPLHSLAAISASLGMSGCEHRVLSPTFFLNKLIA